ncbi:hypothetical protein [Vibrio sp. R78045]|uniref:hypothetical protein n=1 Tax=Vibrio sp. R78045 TaxID=3093868 RepID=UPI0036F3AC97
MTSAQDKQKQKIKEASMFGAVRRHLKEHGIELEDGTIRDNVSRLHEIVDAAKASGNKGDFSEYIEEHKVEITEINRNIDLYLTGADKPIELNDMVTDALLPGNKLTTKHMVIVPPALIEDYTYVIEENTRNQKSLNESTLQYILKTLSTEGQHNPAEAFWDAELNKWAIMDGSSRRWSCKLANRPFRFWVLTEKPTTEVASYFSRVGNDTKPPSAWEIGKDMHSWAQQNECTDLNVIAEQFKIKKPRVSVLLNAFRIVPQDVYDLFPSSTSISREIIESLVPSFRRLILLAKGDEVKEVEYVSQLISDFLDEKTPATDKEAIELIQELITDVAPKPIGVKKWSSSAIGQFKYKPNKEGNGFTLEVEGCTAEFLTKIKNLIEDK